GLEHARQVLGRYAGPIVLDLDDHLAGYAVRADRDVAAFTGGVGSVVQDVRPDLVESAAERPDLGQLPVELPVYRDPAQTVPQDRQRVLDAVMDVHDLLQRLVHERVGLHGSDKLRDALSA